MKTKEVVIRRYWLRCKKCREIIFPTVPRQISKLDKLLEIEDHVRKHLFKKSECRGVRTLFFNKLEEIVIDIYKDTLPIAFDPGAEDCKHDYKPYQAFVKG